MSKTLSNSLCRGPESSREVRDIIVIDARKPVRIDWKEILSKTDLLWFLIRRDISVRYKQTAVGVGWAIIKPLVSMVVFTVFLGLIARFPSDGIPYPVFYFSGLVVWSYFSTAISMSSESFVGNVALITKVYIPRVLVPLSPVLSGLLDLVIALGLLLVMAVYYDASITSKLFCLPVFILPPIVMAAAIGIFVAPLAAKYRDFQAIVALLTQVWMFACPLIYPVSVIPERFRVLYSLNPLVGSMEGIRWAFFDTKSDPWLMLAIGVGVAILSLAVSLVCFRWSIRRVADYI